MGNYVNFVLRTGATVVRMLVYLVTLFVISWQSSLVMAVIFAAIFFPILLILRENRRLGAFLNTEVAELNFRLLELLSGIRVVKVFNTEEAEAKNSKAVTDAIYRGSVYDAKIRAIATPFAQTMFAAVIVLILMVFAKTNIDLIKKIPYIFVYFYAVMNILSQFSYLNEYLTGAAGERGAFKSYEGLLKKIGAMAEDKGSIRPQFNKNIEFKNVCFSYGKKDNIVLNDLSFSVPKNTRIGIVGVSGAGKTTIGSLLLRFYDADSGVITIDDVDLRKLDVHSWRRKVGLVSQDIFIFNRTIRDNIAYGRPAARMRRSGRPLESPE